MSAVEYDLIVVGAGPAGLIAAGRAAERGRRVLLLERGPAPGLKLLLTGGGRCNVTNIAPLPLFLKVFGREGGFLRTALSLFPSDSLRRWLAERGVETIVEERGCVFPVAGGARAVLTALMDYTKLGNVELHLRCRADALVIEGGRLAGVCSEGRTFRANRVLVASGGLSYPETGCTGDGYRLAQQAGHAIVPTYAAVGGIETAESWPRELQGTPAGTIGVAVRGATGRALARAEGLGLWTHYGVSGPAILDVSIPAVQALRRGDEVTLELDLLPAVSAAELEQGIVRAAATQGKRMVQTVLAEYVPRRTAATLLKLAGIGPDRQMSQCSKDQRKAVVTLLKRGTLHVAGPRPIEEATVTGGGVPLAEVDSARMESRLLPGLHFAGEVLDLQGPCGGFNLQAAFATGYLVGEQP